MKELTGERYGELQYLAECWIELMRRWARRRPDLGYCPCSKCGHWFLGPIVLAKKFKRLFKVY